MRRLVYALLLLGTLLFCLPTAYAHDIPRSRVELRLEEENIAATVDAPFLGLSYELPFLRSGSQGVKADGERITGYLAGRLILEDATGRRLTPQPQDAPQILPDGKTVRLRLRYEEKDLPRNSLIISGRLFPSDPVHKTFVLLYGADGALEREEVLDENTPAITYTPGTQQGTLAVVRQFLREGIHHIFIGPDHILFVVGLLLLGGSIRLLLKVVTGFTIAHSVTLVLATLGLVNPPSKLVETTIAVSIVFVGLHALWVMHRRNMATSPGTEQATERHDLRLPLAFGFGLIHGFGFASVLGELELPRHALGWSLFSFNIGVEVGQACIVLAVAPLLALLQRRNPTIARRVVTLAAWGVILAGAYWFGERIAS